MGVKETAVVQKYAQNFVDRYGDREDIWHVYDEVQHIVHIIRDTRLNRILISSTVSTKDKEEFIRILRRSEYRFVNDLVEAIIQEGNADLLLSTLEEVLLKISKSKNEFDMVITSIQSLSDEQKQRLAALAESRFDVKVRNVLEQIDREILGGFIVTVNHRVIDASVRTQLKDIRKKL
ncbi:F0F1 ATP synthase subunit delta [Streptococcus sp. X16XC17]|uniref:F0F1 ATP synthase subunit delta n=1 Tax=unclassified Streptococcus TaxID=2608887 RepID=UPI00066FFC57|nr:MULTISPECIES: F0F1 ATP synthase subunit delta [unclassified Streptococcus]TCD46556.1 F0F1 ATP synthase subunit delta [Streptococcus sp. X16XC17]